MTTNKYIDGVKNENWPAFNKHIWQRSFHDHIVRNEKSLGGIREYIVNNPAEWDNDEENMNHISKTSNQYPGFRICCN